jgi:aldehyde dehydrogenase (NAD+)
MFEELMRKQQEYYHSKKTRSYSFRYKQLDKLRTVILDHEELIIDALEKDLGKSSYEAITSEIGITLSEIHYLMKNLKKLMKYKKVKSNIINFGSTSFTYNEPYGNVLVISPWNYPFQLAMSPIVGAIAAGNTIVLKPSEYSTHTTDLLYKLLTENFESGYMDVVTGGVEETTELLKYRFDLIFFTGSPMVGSIVMKAASAHLTPVVLELGGKSPCIIDEKVDLDLVARRVIFGKAINSGQTCVAPDYLLVHEHVKNKFIETFEKQLQVMYGHDLLTSVDYGKMINDKNFDRVINYIKDGEVLVGGSYNKSELHIDLTLLEVTDMEEPVMKDEIFGPVLPLVTFKSLEEVERIISNNPDPLALYVFSENKQFTDYVIHNIHFGGGCINDTIMHLTNEHLPFGGRGTSGVGRYHGKHSYETFTHEKAVLKSSTKIDLPLKYPKGGKKFIHVVKRLLYK